MISNVFSVIAIINIKIILLSAQFMNYPINYPFGPFYYPPAEPTFEDIIKRRQNFDIESVMDFPTEPPSEPPEEVNDNQLHDDHLYNDNQQNDNHKNGNQLADDQPSESDQTAQADQIAQSDQTDQTAQNDQTAQAEFANLSDGCLRCICEV